MPDLQPETLRRLLPECLAVPRFVEEVAAGGPYASLIELEAKASAATLRLTPEEVEQALAHHPRIGERPAGDGTAQEFSRREQSSVDADDAELAAAIAEGNRAYEEKFGRVFLIRAAGRSRREILQELQRRLESDPDAELAQVSQELHDITMLRIRSLWGGEAA